MKVINIPRNWGKTTELIRQSAQTGYPIVTPTKQAPIYRSKAEEMGLPIPVVLTVEELKRSNYKRVYIDEAGYLLEQLLEVEVEAFTISGDG